MNSQVQFAMHPDDEAVFFAEILRDPSVLLIDGPRWKTSVPETTRDPANVGWYCIIWSPMEMDKLEARLTGAGDWYCRSEFATIQFLRSRLNGERLLAGRIAMGTCGDDPSSTGVEQRYKALSKFIKKTFRNSIVQWWNLNAPVVEASAGRSPNPSKPDKSLWVGPHALAWLTGDPKRAIEQIPNGPVVARLCKCIV